MYSNFSAECQHKKNSSWEIVFILFRRKKNEYMYVPTGKLFSHSVGAYITVNASRGRKSLWRGRTKRENDDESSASLRMVVSALSHENVESNIRLRKKIILFHRPYPTSFSVRTFNGRRMEMTRIEDGNRERNENRTSNGTFSRHDQKVRCAWNIYDNLSSICSSICRVIQLACMQLFCCQKDELFINEPFEIVDHKNIYPSNIWYKLELYFSSYYPQHIVWFSIWNILGQMEKKV